jgi:hypothetical protein
MQAPRADILIVPCAQSLSYSAPMPKLIFFATTAALYNDALTRGLPAFDSRVRPRTLVPGSHLTGTKPRNAASSLELEKSFDPSTAVIRLGVFSPMPGIALKRVTVLARAVLATMWSSTLLHIPCIGRARSQCSGRWKKARIQLNRERQIARSDSGRCLALCATAYGRTSLGRSCS